MTKSLFEFAKENPKIERENVKFDQKKPTEEELRKKVEHYSKFSQDKLLSELFSQVEKKKQNGEFNFENLVNQIEGIKPMLSPDQIKNIDKLLKQIEWKENKWEPAGKLNRNFFKLLV